MNELININQNTDRPTVSGRELHEALEIETRYNDWFKRMCEYGFTEDKDFYSILSKTPEGGRPNTDHQLTIDMAKEICMIQRSEKGRQFRQYFIEVENQWNSPEAVLARALKIADRKLETANIQIKDLQVKVSALTVDNQIMQPKADYFDELVDRNLLTGIRETAKELKVKQKVFVDFLLEKKYLYRDKKGKLTPYSKYIDTGLFEVKEFSNEKSNFASTQTLVTPKGKETFRLLLIEA